MGGSKHSALIARCVMTNFKDTQLWKDTLGRRSAKDSQTELREQLRSSFRDIRKKAKQLAATIPETHPLFTVHDVTHLDALWGLASLVIGEKVPVNPAEAYVLGVAFLVHDLGMTPAAYPNGIDHLRSKPSWGDLVVSRLSHRLGRRPSEDELNDLPSAVEKEVTGIMLRLHHAEGAEKVVSEQWLDSVGNQHFLISDEGLREAFGHVIGQIAHSHWWSIEEVRDTFQGPPTGASAELSHPETWTIDRLKLAGIIRLADVIHLDARRAPLFLRVIRSPSGIAELHWNFQAKLRLPQRQGEELVFTAKEPFLRDEAASWWQCFEAIGMAHSEFLQVNRLFQDSYETSLPIRAVAGANDPRRLAEFVKTQGWDPVDIRVHVSSVPELVRKLGGRQIYGRNPHIPLRELIQNGADAIRFRRATFDAAPGSTLGITIRTGSDEHGDWIEVEDRGIGMSEEVLTGPLLDFGTSYWGSELMLRERPGMLAKGYAVTGKFGIGFFSVFMWGSKVKIVTGHPEEAMRDTRVLEFEKGLEVPPLLRRAEEHELLPNGGTQVRVWLRAGLNGINGILDSVSKKQSLSADSFSLLCAKIACALDVDVFVEEKDSDPVQVISADDWKEISGEALLRRVHGMSIDISSRYGLLIEAAGENIRPLYNSDGRTVGRICLVPQSYFRGARFAGIITVGGLHATFDHNLAGVLSGEPDTAARDEATVLPPAQESLSKWASIQTNLIQNLTDDATELFQCADILWKMGGDIDSLPIAKHKGDWWTYNQLAQANDLPDQIVVASIHDVERFNTAEARPDLFENVFLTRISTGTGVRKELLFRRSEFDLAPKLDHPAFSRSRFLIGAFFKALSEAWNVKVIDIMNSSTVGYSGQRERVGLLGDAEIEVNVGKIVKP